MGFNISFVLTKLYNFFTFSILEFFSFSQAEMSTGFSYKNKQQKNKARGKELVIKKTVYLEICSRIIPEL